MFFSSKKALPDGVSYLLDMYSWRLSVPTGISDAGKQLYT